MRFSQRHQRDGGESGRGQPGQVAVHGGSHLPPQRWGVSESDGRRHRGQGRAVGAVLLRGPQVQGVNRPTCRPVRPLSLGGAGNHQRTDQRPAFPAIPCPPRALVGCPTQHPDPAEHPTGTQPSRVPNQRTKPTCRTRRRAVIRRLANQDPTPAGEAFNHPGIRVPDRRKRRRPVLGIDPASARTRVWWPANVSPGRPSHPVDGGRAVTRYAVEQQRRDLTAT